MLIYRVENAKGKGMYQISSDAIRMVEAQYHPSPFADKLLGNTWKLLYDANLHSRFIFGFSSKAKLKSWVYKKEWREFLDKKGFSINLYEAPVFFEGKTQTIFLKKAAQRISNLSLLKL